ncbi:tRNA lysidine(34) synthetase TilS [Allorhizobium sp. BGMRC 0089]|uniref:tRNA lysidine(34) synthetase TilS n=1 Tax=Allorhizobium sonneratiae TaxID=2934936 RepID=UPI0020348517|nr:tRNA lysidine(34) synthetase TilS [Allorhizobium sonneratiae]MCM2290915.1 tRNA lysidine(34) synthetase TilS [Allorhizobium sonneratiae]
MTDARDASCCPTVEIALADFLQKAVRPLRLLVALSGGSDSTGLLIGLHNAVKAASALPFPVSLAAATVDHGLRAASAQEARQAADLCRSLGIDHSIMVWEGAKPQTGVSAAARAARYRLLSEAAAAAGADAIVTGHTADDQAETIEMRRRRQSNPTAPGLSGMADAVLYRNRVWIYRPFLTLRRDTIRTYLSSRNYGWVDDPSNSNPAYERAQLRLTGVEPATADGQARHRLSQIAAELIRNHIRPIAPGLILLHPGMGCDSLDQDTAPAHIHAISRLTACLGGRPHGPGREQMTALLSLFKAAPGARLTVGRCLAHRHRDGLLLLREDRNLPRLELDPGSTILWDGRFEITNRSEKAVTVGAAAETRPAARKGDEPSLLERALRTQPHIHPHMPTATLEIKPIIAPYHDFLPGFERQLAMAFCDLFAAPPLKPGCFTGDSTEKKP